MISTLLFQHAWTEHTKQFKWQGKQLIWPMSTKYTDAHVSDNQSRIQDLYNTKQNLSSQKCLGRSTSWTKIEFILCALTLWIRIHLDIKKYKALSLKQIPKCFGIKSSSLSQTDLNETPGAFLAVVHQQETSTWTWWCGLERV